MKARGVAHKPLGTNSAIHTGRPHRDHLPCDTDGCRCLKKRLRRARCELLEDPGGIYAPGAVYVHMGVCVCRCRCVCVCVQVSAQVYVGVCVQVSAQVCRDLTCQPLSQLQARPVMASGLSPFWPLPCAQVCQVGAAWTR